MASEQRLIDAEELWKKFESEPWYDNADRDEIALPMVDDAPTVDAVSRGVHDQVRWERDIAIGQLESYGVSLGEKADVVKVVRCKDCKHWHRETISCEMNCYLVARERPCWYEDDFCSYGERKD